MSEKGARVTRMQREHLAGSQVLVGAPLNCSTFSIKTKKEKKKTEANACQRSGGPAGSNLYRRKPPMPAHATIGKHGSQFPGILVLVD